MKSNSTDNNENEFILLDLIFMIIMELVMMKLMIHFNNNDENKKKFKIMERIIKYRRLNEYIFGCSKIVLFDKK